uniref:Uncharacterized protein n=1 Tax=Proboscia inermis TaxID=420281 RepID=A0A7S0C7T6_9STRA
MNRYGFCLETNWEPDRSCNDVVEFKIEQPYEDPSVTVELRAGPKSYTYGGFVKALECFLFNDEEQNDGGDDDEDGMEAFLEEEEDEEGFGMMYGTMDDEMEDDDDMNQSTQAECTALEKLSVSLETARQGHAL